MVTIAGGVISGDMVVKWSAKLFDSATAPVTLRPVASSMRPTVSMLIVPDARGSSKDTITVAVAGTFTALSAMDELMTTGGTMSATRIVTDPVVWLLAASFVMHDTVTDACGAAELSTWNAKVGVVVFCAGSIVNVSFPVAGPETLHAMEVTPILSAAVTVAVPLSPGLYRTV